MSGAHALDSVSAITGPPTVRNGLLDMFLRQRTSSPATVFDSKLIADAASLVWDDQQTAGGGTGSAHVANNACVRMSVGNLTAGTRVRQTYVWHPYQPGKSQLVLMTGLLGAATTGITRRVGQFNDRNGLFYEQTSAGLYVVRRTYVTGSAVDNPVLQSAWNIDRLDGSKNQYNPSQILLDPTKVQIMFLAYEWLGVGSVLYGFIIDEKLVPVHAMRHANVLTSVYMSMPNLPLRYEISNSGAGPAASLDHICSTVISEGGEEITGRDVAVDRDAVALTTNNDSNLYPIVAVRLTTGYEFAKVVPINVHLLATSNANIYWRLLRNPTITGVALSWTTLTGSGIDYDVSRVNTSTVSGGTTLRSGYAAANEAESGLDIAPEFRLGSTIAGVSDVLVLAAGRLTGTSEPIYGSLGMRVTL